MRFSVYLFYLHQRKCNKKNLLKQTHNFYSFENVSTRELLIVEVFFFISIAYRTTLLGNLKINNQKKISITKHVSM